MLRTMIGPNDFWIVRCDPAKTLELVAVLHLHDFEAWTPRAEREYRKSRSKKFVRVWEPLLYSFIFVRAGANPKQCAERLDDLRYRYGIRVMRNNGQYAGTPDASLDGLRKIESDAATFGIDNMVKADQFKIGDRGSIESFSFSGVKCTLVGRSGKNLIVQMDDSTLPITVKPVMFKPEK